MKCAPAPESRYVVMTPPVPCFSYAADCWLIQQTIKVAFVVIGRIIFLVRLFCAPSPAASGGNCPPPSGYATGLPSGYTQLVHFYHSYKFTILKVYNFQLKYFDVTALFLMQFCIHCFTVAFFIHDYLQHIKLHWVFILLVVILLTEQF